MSDSRKKRRRKAEGRVGQTPVHERTHPRENPPVDQERLRQAREALSQVSGN